MKKTFLTVLFFYNFTGIAVAQNLSKTTEYKILLTGASFASPQNGWFEIGCRKLNAEAINRAIGGEAIANTANRMANVTLYSKEELENIKNYVYIQNLRYGDHVSLDIDVDDEICRMKTI